MSWFQNIESKKVDDPAYFDDDAVQLPASLKEEEHLVAFLFWIRKLRGQKDFAEILQRALFARNSHTVRLIVAMGLQAKVSPEDFFFMMPIAGGFLIVALKRGKGGPSCIVCSSSGWSMLSGLTTKYVRARGEVMVRWSKFAPAQSQTCCIRVFDGTQQHIRDLVVLLEHLCAEGDMFRFGSDMQQLLLAKYPRETETMMFEI